MNELKHSGKDDHSPSTIMFIGLFDVHESDLNVEFDSARPLEELRIILQGTLQEFPEPGTIPMQHGFIIEFTDPLRAIELGIRIQTQLHERNKIAAPDQRIKARIGLHFTANPERSKFAAGLAADMVSKIAALAPDGGITFTEAINQKIRDKIKYPCEDLGRRELRNIAQPIQVYSVELPWLFEPLRQYFAPHNGVSKTKQKILRPVRILFAMAIIGIILWYFWQSYDPFRYAPKSIAVLPIENRSGRADCDTLCDGLTSGIIRLMTPAKRLIVIAKTSSDQFSDTDKNYKQIAKALQADAVLSGSLRCSGNAIYIAVQLLDRFNPDPLWSGEYNVKPSDLVGIQKEITQNILRAMEMDKDKSDNETSSEIFSENFDAYRNFIRGEYAKNHWASSEILKGINLFKMAVQADPQFALAYASLTEAYIRLSALDLGRSDRLYPLARQAALDGLGKNDQLAELHTALATVNLYYDWNREEAEQGFLHAMELNPGYASAKSGYAFFLTLMGRFEEARKMRNEAERHDPVSVGMEAETGLAYYFGEKYKESIERFESVIEQDSLFYPAYINLGYACSLMGQNEDAVRVATKAVELFKDHPGAMALLAYVSAASGNSKLTGIILSEFDNLSADKYISPYSIAAIHVALNQIPEALGALETAFHEKDRSLVRLKVDPVFKTLHSETRFQQLLRAMKLN